MNINYEMLAVVIILNVFPAWSDIHNATTHKNHLEPGQNYSTADHHTELHLNDISMFKETLCMVLNISMTDCSCQIIPQLCAMDRKIEVLQNIVYQNTSKVYKRSNETTIIYSSIALLASLISLLGNTAVIITAYQNRGTLPPCKVHIAQLSVVNFVFSLVQIINTVPLYWTNTWIYGAFMCKFVRSLLEFSSFLSIGYIGIIAVGRYYLVVSPIRSQRISKRWKDLAVVINIVIVIATIIPYSITLGIENYTGRCVVFQHGQKSLLLLYNCGVLVLYSIVPIFLLFFLAVRMTSKLTSPDSQNLTCDNSIQLRINKRNDRVMNITLSIFLFFIICTLPARVITIYIELVGYQTIDFDSYVVLTLISYFTYPLQNILNPILYSMTAKTWRRQAKTSLASLTFISKENQISL